MRRQAATSSFLRTYKAFLHKHPELEKKTEQLMDRVAVVRLPSADVYALHGKLAKFHAARISQSYRLVFALEPDKVTFIDIGSHDEVY